jgi:uncharacterized protein
MSDSLPLQLRVHRSLSEIPRAAWDALVPPEGVPFVEWGWLAALEESGTASAERGWRPLHLALWEGNRLVAAAPAWLKFDSDGEFVFDRSWAAGAERLGISYYPKLVVGVPFTPATGARLLTAPGENRTARVEQLMQGALEMARSEGHSSVHVLFCTPEEAALLEQIGFAHRLGVQYQWHNPGYRSFDDFLGRFRSKRRNQLVRERRAPSEQGITLETLRGEALSRVDPAELFRLYESTVERHPFGQRALRPGFFEVLLERFRDRLELVEARRSGRLVGGAFNVASPDVLYGRYWGCFEEYPFLHFNACLYHPVEECIARGLRRFEPGAGGEHKLVRGFEPTLTHSAHWIFNPRLDRAIRNFVLNEADAIQQGLPRWYEETGFRRGPGTQGSRAGQP